MRSRVNCRTVCVASAFVGGAVLAGNLAFMSFDPPQARMIEEDWQLVLNEPRTAVTAPQFHTVISPSTSMNGLYFQVTWNYRELDSFADGGLQMQIWNGESDFASREVGSQPLSTDAETVTWTARMSTDQARVTFSIVNGHSSSWGGFGGESMTVHTAKPVQNLNTYSPDISVENSWITFGSNRVQSLVLRAVRRYNQDGELISEDLNPRVVFEQSDGGDM